MDPKHHDTAKRLQARLTGAYPLFRWRVVPEVLFEGWVVFEVSTVATVNGKSLGAYCQASRALVEDYPADALPEIANTITKRLTKVMLEFGRKNEAKF